MNINSAFTGHLQENPLHYQKCGLRELIIVQGGRTIESVDATKDCKAYITTMKAMNFNEEIPELRNYLFLNHYKFDLTLLQDAGEVIHYPELRGESVAI